MRTTLNIDDEALDYARKRARITGMSLGQVVSEALLVEQKPRKSYEIKAHPKTGWPYLETYGKGKPVTPEMIQRALDEDDIERYVPFRR